MANLAAVEGEAMTTKCSKAIRSERRSRRTVYAAAAGISAILAIGVGACGGTQSASDGSSSIRGGDLYETNCASCHGSDLRGTPRGPSQLSIVYEPAHHSDDSFRSAIARGAGQHHWNFGNMEPVPGLSDDEVEEIIAFVRAEQQRQGFEAYEGP